MDIPYIPYENRTPDLQYQTVLADILNSDWVAPTQMEMDERATFGAIFHFKIENGFPAITERDVSKVIFQQALGELCAFLNGAHTQEALESFGCRWWKSWVSEKKCVKRGLPVGDLGPGSYGPAWTAFPMPNGETFNQIKHMIEQIKELPHLRTHYITPWIPFYNQRGKGKVQKSVVSPCHGDVQIEINIRTRKMKLIHKQRSADYLIGFPANVIQYGALLLMIAQVTGYIPDELVYMVSNAHIYTPAHEEDAKKILYECTGERLPTVTVNPDIQNLEDFRPEHFSLHDYYPQNEWRKIWTPV